MTTDVDELILSRFLTAYGPPNTGDEDGFFAEYRDALGSVRRDVLKRVSDHVVWKHVYPTWPTVGRCLEALRSINTEHEGRTPNQPEPSWVASYKPPREAEKARVAKMTADFKARMQRLEADYVGSLPAPPAVDRISWNRRQGDMLAAGKWCLSLFLSRRAA